MLSQRSNLKLDPHPFVALHSGIVGSERHVDVDDQIPDMIGSETGCLRINRPIWTPVPCERPETIWEAANGAGRVADGCRIRSEPNRNRTSRWEAAQLTTTPV